MSNNPTTDFEQADADTVATRAAQVIASMGADIRALTGERDRYRLAWRSARERAQAYGEGILRVVKDRETYQEWLRQAEARLAALPAVPVPPATHATAPGQAALRDRIADALAGVDGWTWAPGFKAGSLAWQDYLKRADAVLAVLPPPADRAGLAAGLRAAADEIAGIDFHPNARARSLDIAAGLARRLRRMADEAEHQPAAGAGRDGAQTPPEARV